MAETASSEVMSPVNDEKTDDKKDLTSDEETKKLIRKQQKLEMKLAARAKSKEKRKQNKQEKKKQDREENVKRELESLNSTTVDLGPKAGSTFDADRTAMIQQLAEIRSDKSRAGRVDEQILPFVDTINSLRDAYTTSSCAGRTIVACSFRDASKNKKFNVAWVYLTHDMADSKAAFAAVQKFLVEKASDQHVHEETASNSVDNVTDVEEQENDETGDEIWFKMEPVIVAIRLRSVAAARQMLNIARTSGGLKNCGIRSIGTDGTVMLTLVDTYKIEALVAKDSQLLITQEYMDHLVESANRKLVATRERLEKLRQIIEASHLPKATGAVQQ